MRVTLYLSTGRHWHGELPAETVEALVSRLEDPQRLERYSLRIVEADGDVDHIRGIAVQRVKIHANPPAPEAVSPAAAGENPHLPAEYREALEALADAESAPAAEPAETPAPKPGRKRGG